MRDVKQRNTGLSKLYIATLAAMDGSGVRRRTPPTAIASLALATLALWALGPVGAAAQSAGDRQYADPLAGGGQEPAPPSGGGTGADQPDAPTPVPAPTAPAPSGPDTSTGGADGSTAAPAAGGETLPHTGAEPVPAVATGLLLLLLGGVLLRVRTLRRDAI